MTGGFLGGSVGKESACNTEDTGDVDLIPGLANSWEMVKDREAWYAIVHGVTKGQT